jgi:hypothetical protein
MERKNARCCSSSDAERAGRRLTASPWLVGDQCRNQETWRIVNASLGGHKGTMWKNLFSTHLPANERQVTTVHNLIFCSPDRSSSSRKERPVLAKLHTFALSGIDAVAVTAEVDASAGLPKTIPQSESSAGDACHGDETESCPPAQFSAILGPAARAGIGAHRSV